MEIAVRRALGSREGAVPGTLLVCPVPALRALGSVAGEILAALADERTEEFVRCLRETVEAHRAARSLLTTEPQGRA